MLFSDLIGQQQIAAQLRTMWGNQRLPHALILLGPEGCGNLSLALALAQYILCEQKTGYDACGSCSNCGKMSRFIHPDLHFVYPVVGAKITSDHYLKQWRNALEENPYQSAYDWLQYIGAENKQGNITKEECLSIVKKLSLKTFEGQAKVMLIWLPEYLGKEGNRLLKIIEEPPPNTYFILVAEKAELILNTILSRCQLIKIGGLQDDDIIRQLSKDFSALGQDHLHSIAYLANGNYNEAIKLAGAQLNNNSQLLLDLLRKCYKGNGLELVKWSEVFAKLGRENQKHFFQYALHFLREFLQVKLLPNQQARLGKEEEKTAKNLANVLEIDQVDEMMKLFTDAAYYIERNGNPKIVMLDGSIRLSKIIKKQKAAS